MTAAGANLADAVRAGDRRALARALTFVENETAEGLALLDALGAAGAPQAVETPLGGERFLEELEDDPLPRIC